LFVFKITFVIILPQAIVVMFVYIFSAYLDV